MTHKKINCLTFLILISTLNINEQIVSPCIPQRVVIESLLSETYYFRDIGLGPLYSVFVQFDL